MGRRKLLSMVDYVLKFDKDAGYYEDESDFLHKQIEFMGYVMEYAKFLKQPLTLGMYVPCDEKGNPLDEPIINGILTNDNTPLKSTNTPEGREYIKAKEKVLFKGFYKEYNAIRSTSGGYLNESLFNHTVELMSTADIEITDSVIKKYKL